MSATAIAGSTASGGPSSVNAALPADVSTVGLLLTSSIAIARCASGRSSLSSAKSLTRIRTSRAGPGELLVVANVTDRSAASY